MARFKMELPTEIMSDVQRIYDNTDQIFGEMTKAGAEVALSNMVASAPSTVRSYGKLTRTYKTPSDDGINTKAYFSGYIPFSNPHRKYFQRSGRNGAFYYTSKGVPVEFLCNLYEYGRSNSPFPKKPFVRKAFNKSKIESVMLAAQTKASGGLLKDE